MAPIVVEVERGEGLMGLEEPVADSCRDINIDWSSGGPAEAGSFIFIVMRGKVEYSWQLLVFATNKITHSLRMGQSIL